MVGRSEGGRSDVLDDEGFDGYACEGFEGPASLVASKVTSLCNIEVPVVSIGVLIGVVDSSVESW